jgi:hypothetical protein
MSKDVGRRTRCVSLQGVTLSTVRVIHATITRQAQRFLISIRKTLAVKHQGPGLAVHLASGLAVGHRELDAVAALATGDHSTVDWLKLGAPVPGPHSVALDALVAVAVLAHHHLGLHSLRHTQRTGLRSRGDPARDLLALLLLAIDDLRDEWRSSSRDLERDDHAFHDLQLPTTGGVVVDVREREGFTGVGVQDTWLRDVGDVRLWAVLLRNLRERNGRVGGQRKEDGSEGRLV